MKEFKAYFFDLDGTLIDSVPDLTAAIDAMLGQLSLPSAGVTKVSEWVGNGASMLVKRALCDAASIEYEQLLSSDYERGFELFIAAYQVKCCESSVLYPTVIDTVKGLSERGVHLAIITNKPSQFTRVMLEHYGLMQYFELVLSGDSLSAKKPDPLPLQHAINYFSVAADQCLMVGDSMSDVAAAKAAKVAVAAVNYGYNHGQDISLTSPDWLISSLDELLK